MEFIAIFSPIARDWPIARGGGAELRDPLVEAAAEGGVNTVIRFRGASLDSARQRLWDLPIVRSGLASVQVFPLVSLVPDDAVLAPN